MKPNAPRTLHPNQEHVHAFTFEVGEGEFVHDMTARAASEEEARDAIKRRLVDAGMTRPRPMKLVSTTPHVGVRTRAA